MSLHVMMDVDGNTLGAAFESVAKPLQLSATPTNATGWADVFTSAIGAFGDYNRTKLEREYIRAGQAAPASMLSPQAPAGVASSSGLPAWVIPAGVAAVALFLVTQGRRR